MSRFDDRIRRGRIIAGRNLRHLMRPSALTRFSPGFIFPAAFNALDASYIGVNHEGSATSNSYSFAAQGIGAAASDRYVFLNIQWFSTANVPVLTGCSIGGVACTIVLQSTSANNRPNNAIAYALVPSGITGTIAFTFSGVVTGTGHGVGFGVYRVQGPLNPTPVATRQNDTANVSSLSTSIAVKKNGFMIWSVTQGNASFVMNAPAQNYGRQYGAGRNGYGAFGSGYSTDTNQALTLSSTFSAAQLQDVAVSFEPL